MEVTASATAALDIHRAVVPVAESGLHFLSGVCSESANQVRPGSCMSKRRSRAPRPLVIYCPFSCKVYTPRFGLSKRSDGVFGSAKDRVILCKMGHTC